MGVMLGNMLCFDHGSYSENVEMIWKYLSVVNHGGTCEDLFPVVHYGLFQIISSGCISSLDSTPDVFLGLNPRRTISHLHIAQGDDVTHRTAQALTGHAVVGTEPFQLQMLTGEKDTFLI